MNIQTKIDTTKGEIAYESDFALWAIEQARLLREGRFAALDLLDTSPSLQPLLPEMYEKHGEQDEVARCGAFSNMSANDAKSKSVRCLKNLLMMSKQHLSRTSFRLHRIHKPCIS